MTVGSIMFQFCDPSCQAPTDRVLILSWDSFTNQLAFCCYRKSLSELDGGVANRAALKIFPSLSTIHSPCCTSLNCETRTRKNLFAKYRRFIGNDKRFQFAQHQIEQEHACCWTEETWWRIKKSGASVSWDSRGRKYIHVLCHQY